MADRKAVEQWQKSKDADSCDSDEEQMMEDYLKQRKLMKKMKKEQAVQKHGKAGNGVGEIQWERHSESSGTKWGAEFEFQKGMLGTVSTLGVRGSVGYESRYEKKSVKAVAKFPF